MHFRLITPYFSLALCIAGALFPCRLDAQSVTTGSSGQDGHPVYTITRGGISMGSYMAGVNWALAELIAQIGSDVYFVGNRFKVFFRGLPLRDAHHRFELGFGLTDITGTFYWMIRRGN